VDIGNDVGRSIYGKKTFYSNVRIDRDANAPPRHGCRRDRDRSEREGEEGSRS